MSMFERYQLRNFRKHLPQNYMNLPTDQEFFYYDLKCKLTHYIQNYLIQYASSSIVHHLKYFADF